MSHGPSHSGHPAPAAHAHIDPSTGAHHHHVVVSKRILVGILLTLMFFTLLTVGAAQAESWIAHRFDVVIPQWVNVAVALSIAAVKSMIVAGWFMQLRYDNPMNSAIAIFTVMCLASFLGFTMIDLGQRDAIYAYKMKHIIPGGIGGFDTVPANTSIAQHARLRAEEQIAALEAAGKPLPKALAKYKEHKAAGGHGHTSHGSPVSTADHSRVKKGITLPELGGPAHDTGHGDAPSPPTPAAPAKPAH